MNIVGCKLKIILSFYSRIFRLNAFIILLFQRGLLTIFLVYTFDLPDCGPGAENEIFIIYARQI